jgi:glycosyltransferase involved in cell wall biosynthesis
MTIVQITPGAGGMYCGNCFRDNALVAELRKLGHNVTMLPLYLPMTLDEPDQSAGAPLFFGGVNVYLEQKSALFRHMPAWLHRWLASPRVLQWAAGRAAKTRASDVGELTLSMMRGEEGRQARELNELVGWLKAHNPPDIVCLSNALLVGMVRELKRELNVPVVVTLQGEDTFLDALPPGDRDTAWQLLTERARDVDLFVAPSHYYADLMTRRLQLKPQQVRVLHNGINLDGFEIGNQSPAAGDHSVGAPLITEARSLITSPTLGYFARMCREKGLPLVADTFIEIRRRNRVPTLKLHIGGGCGPSDVPVVSEVKARLEKAGLLGDVEFFPNLDRAGKIALLRSFTIFCTPALYGEAFGLYVIEALAAGVPVVQPRHGSFPEIIEQTGGGLITAPDSASLAAGIESLLLDPGRARALGETGRKAVQERFSIQHLAAQTVAAYAEVRGAKR